MIDGFDVVSRCRPIVGGSTANTSESATRDFVGFLNESKPDEKRRRASRPLIVAVVFAVLLTFGGVAAAVYGEIQSDGVVFTTPEVTAVVDSGLVVVVRESNLGTCIDVRVAGGSAGGCGPLELPLNIGVGGVGGSSFLSGYGPSDSDRIEVEFAHGTVVVIDEFQSFDL